MAFDGRLRERIKATTAPRIACGGKISFATAGAAWKAIGVMNRAHAREAGELHAYRCPACHAYHVGRVRAG